MKTLGSRCSKISCGLRLFFFFGAILAFTSSGAASQLTVNPSSINFGSVSVGNSQTQSVTLANSGGPKLTITQATLSGTGFTLSGLSYPVTLAGGQSVTCDVTFTPQSPGTNSGSVAIRFITHGRNHNGFTAIRSIAATLPVSGTGVPSGQLTANPTSLGFGSVQVGNSQTLSETLTNSGGTSVMISAASSSSSAFTTSGLSLPITLNAGQSVSFNVAFSPTSGGSASGNLAITSNASNPALNVPLSGTGTTPGQLTASPTNLGFGSVQVGNSQTLSETLTNSGGTSVMISAAGSSSSAFTASGLSLPITLNAGQSVNFSAAFSPTSGGSASGNLAITSNASNPALNVPLSGTGTTPGQLTASPTNLGFGSVQVGNSQTLSETLTNSGGTSVMISAAGSSSSAFTTSGLSLPITLKAGQSVNFSATFSPTSGGSASGNLAITSNASNPALNVPLSGTGTTPGQLTASPTNLGFGSVQVGNSQTLSETLTNSGGTSVMISAAGSSSSAFTASGLSLPITLNAGQSVSFSATFSPTSGGSTSGNLAITSTASNPALNVPLSGTGTTPGQLTASPTNLGFGSVQVGNSQTLSETLTNSGGTSVMISAAGSSSSAFTASGLSLPITLNAGQSVNFSATFSPTSGGSASGNLAITSNASNPALNVPLSGTGTTPGQLTASPTNLGFGSVQVGNSQTLSETLTNSGGTSVMISAAGSSSSAFTASGLSLPITLNAGQSVTFSVAFSPTSGGSASGNLAITSNPSNPALNVPLSGTGTTPGQLTASPTNLGFGSVQVGNSQTLSETLTNSGGTSVMISAAGSSSSAFTASGLNLPITLNAGQSVTFNVSFAPQSGGSATGSLVISSNSSNPTLSVSLTGTGALPGQLAVAPSTINFGNVIVGATQNQTGTLSASGAPVTVSSAGVAGSEFSVSGISLPVTIAVGTSVSFQVTFAPQSSGTASANLTFASNASNAPTVQSLTGSGTPPPQHSVALTWNASTSGSVVGYNVYRGTGSGGPYAQINSALDATTSDTDSAVQGGQTYYYVVTAVDSTGGESSYSNEVQAVIPYP